MPYADRERKLAYDRAYRIAHRAQREAAKTRFRYTSKGILSEEAHRQKRDHGGPSGTEN